MSEPTRAAPAPPPANPFEKASDEAVLTMAERGSTEAMSELDRRTAPDTPD